MGIKGAPRKIDKAQLRKFWEYAGSRTDLSRIGVEAPEQFAALFAMDGDEIDRIAVEVQPLTDFYPKRLGDVTAEDKSIHSFTANYMNPTTAARDFRSSKLTQQIFPDEILNAQLDPFFAIREMRYHARLVPTNWLAELDVNLRGSNLREPVLEILGSNPLRVALAEKARSSESSPEVLMDLTAAALARRDYPTAIQLLEEKRSKSDANNEDVLLLTYLYCLNREVPKAEAVVITTKDRDRWLTRWLWAKLRSEYGFRPPE